MANAYGNTDGTSNSKFRIVCQYTATDQNNGYYQYRYRFYIQVTTGNFYGTNITKSWGGTTSVSGTGKYGYSSYYTKNVAYGSNFTLGSTAYAQYTSSQTYKSQISGSTKIATAPTKTYTITYNANGGSGAPGKQTKTYGKTLKLSTTKPTRTGYTFQGWGTSASGSVVYAAGANYTANASDTLYAIWKANTYTVTYNANGGSGAPSNQTKTYGVTLKLSTAKPTRTNYNFLGWGTSAASTTVAYAPGANYTGNAAITLYAIWELAYSEPTVTNLTADRCNALGELSDEGQYAKVVFNWQIDAVNSGGLTSVVIQWKQSSATAWNSTTAVSGGTATSGAVSKVVGGNTLDTEYDYDIQVVVTDAKGNATYSIVLPAMKYIIDFLSGGNGVAIGKPAYREGFDIAMDTYFNNNVALLNNIWLQGELSSGEFQNICRINENGQVELDWTTGGLKGRVMKELWSGTWSSGTLSGLTELPYYNIILLGVSTSGTDSSEQAQIIGVKRSSGTGFICFGATRSDSDMRLFSASFATSGTNLQYGAGLSMLYLGDGSVGDRVDKRKIYSITGLI